VCRQMALREWNFVVIDKRPMMPINGKRPAG
jgi:hypothetical protein